MPEGQLCRTLCHVDKPDLSAFLGVRLSFEDFVRLKALSERADVPMSNLVRRLLRDAMPKWEQALDRDRLALL